MLNDEHVVRFGDNSNRIQCSCVVPRKAEAFILLDYLKESRVKLRQMKLLRTKFRCPSEEVLCSFAGSACSESP